MSANAIAFGGIHEVGDLDIFVRLMRELELARAVGHAVRTPAIRATCL